MGAYPTIRLGSDSPAAPANSVNVVFSSTPSLTKPTQVNVRADVVGPGGTTEFLRADGTWAPAGGGSAGFANLVALPTPTGNTNLADWTFWIRIPASGLLVPSVSKIKLGILVTSGPVLIDKAVIRRAAPFGSSFIDSTPVTWASSSSVSLSTGLTFSDEISVSASVDHDIWVLVHTDPTNTGSFAQNTSASFGVGFQSFDAHRGSGDQTATAMGSLSINADYLIAIAQILAE